MTSLIVAAVIAAAVIYCLIRSGRKDAHHLDDLHIASRTDKSSN